MYWLATTHPTGRPHVRPVLAVWADGLLYTTSKAAAQKGRNLAADPRCTVTARTDTMDIVLEGAAAKITSHDTLEKVAEAYRAKYDWLVTVTEGGFDAPYGAPTAGPPPYQPFEITPATVFGFGTAANGQGQRYPLRLLKLLKSRAKPKSHGPPRKERENPTRIRHGRVRPAAPNPASPAARTPSSCRCRPEPGNRRDPVSFEGQHDHPVAAEHRLVPLVLHIELHPRLPVRPGRYQLVPQRPARRRRPAGTGRSPPDPDTPTSPAAW